MRPQRDPRSEWAAHSRAGIATRSCGTRPTKRRRTESEIADLRSALVDTVLDVTPMKVRQVYDQAVTRGLIEQHIPDGHLDVLLAAEWSERDLPRAFGQEIAKRGRRRRGQGGKDD